MFSLVSRKFLAMRNITLYSVVILSKCPNHEEDCSNFCILLRKDELYKKCQVGDFGKQCDNYLFLWWAQASPLSSSVLFYFLGSKSTSMIFFCENKLNLTLKAAACIFFTPFFTAAYNQERLILKTIYVVSKEILQKNLWLIIKRGL